MKKLRALIVDDEKDARDTLEAYLNEYCQTVTVVAKVENIEDAQRALNKYHPDILFLDIEMPFGNAFDLLEQLGKIDVEFIFVTAYSQYALQALNLSAVHYLLKPIDIDELIVAVDKACELVNQRSDINRAAVLLDNFKNVGTKPKKIVLPQLSGFDVKSIDDIVYCQADENFTRFFFKDQSTSLICRNLKYFENLLTPMGFIRIHRSSLINLEFVKKYIKGRGGQIELTTGVTLDVSESKKKKFLECFKD